MSITNVESVTFGVDDLPTSRRFWTDFGLTAAGDAARAASVFVAQDGSGIVLRESGDPTLPAAIEAGSTVREVTFGVQDARALDRVSRELSHDREIAVDADGTVHSTDPLGFPIAFRVTRRTPIAAEPLKFNTPGRPDRINTRGVNPALKRAGKR